VFDQTLHFASEIKAIAASPVFNDTLDLSGLEGYLALGYFLAPKSVYRDVNKLQPGHWMRLSDGRIEIRQYWDVTDFDSNRGNPEQLVGELDALLRTAVHERLESEVPLGAFLSGGIDSALVVSLMAEGADRRVVTTSVGFGERSHNELDNAGLTARYIGTEHYPEVVQPNLEAVIDKIVAGFDEPFADASAIPTYYVSEMARRHVTVALSGDGGDEAFGGYDFRYVPHAIESRIARCVPGKTGRAAAGLLASVWPNSPRLPRVLRLRGLLANLSVDRASAYFADLCFVKPVAVNRLLRQRPHITDTWVFDAVTSAYRRCPSLDPVQCAEYADLKVYLPDDVLTKVDRMSMAHGLEVRCPLLDRRVVEFAFAVPAAAKMPRLRSKVLLRGVARGRVPAAILDLPKRGFTAPVGEWLAGSYADMFRDDVLTSDSRIAGMLDQREVSRLFEENRSARVRHPHALWAVWMLERWAKQVRTKALQPPVLERAASEPAVVSRQQLQPGLD
jgi:asparagine synthase (glutamine-hydrolysing)